MPRHRILQHNADTVIGQSEILLSAMERMSWIAILFATATFVGFLNPPGSFNEGKLWMDYGGPATPPSPLPPGPSSDGGVVDVNLLRAFFIADQLSFFASLATVVFSVAISSMPMHFYHDPEVQA